jgi:hypothetical protein
MRFSKPVLAVLKLLLTLLLLFLVLRSVDVSRILRDLRALNGPALVLLPIAYWVGQLLCSARWRLFAASLGMRNGYFSFVRTYFAGMFFNIGLPSLIGGDVVKAYAVSRKNGRPLRDGLASVFQDRLAGLAALLLFGTAAAAAHPLRWRGCPLWIAYAACWTAMALALGIILRGENLYPGLLKRNKNDLVRKTVQTVADFHNALAARRLNSGALFPVSLYSLFSSALVIWVFHKVTAAAGHTVGIVPFAALFPLITIVTMLPITLGGLGIREWCYVEALSLAGIAPGPALVISLASSALLLLCNLAGLLFLPAIPIGLRPRPDDLSREVPEG